MPTARPRRRLTEAEAREMLEKRHPLLWEALDEAERAPSLPERWRRAPRGSEGWTRAILYEQVLRVLELR